MPDYQISVILPVYNAKAVLPRALESLQRQTLGFAQLEVLLADDCSTDGSWELVQQYARQYPNVRALQTPGNSGSASVPRNLAMAQAAAPYLMFLDNDDTFAPDGCAALLREMQASGADLVTGYFRDVLPDQTPINDRSPSCAVTEARKVYEFPRDYAIMHEVRQIFWCKLYKTALVRASGLSFKPGSNMEDVLFLARYLMACQTMVFCNVPVYNYTVSPDSLSHLCDTRYLQHRAEDIEELRRIYTEAGHPDCFDRQCPADADHYVSLIFTSDRIADPADRLALLAAWRPLVRYTLAHDLYVESEAERALFAQLAQGDAAAFAAAFPLYLLQREHRELTHMRSEVERLNRAYQAVAADNRALCAKIERIPGYKLMQRWKGKR